MVRMKNVTTESVFTIEKQCDRCRNVLYFNESVITDVETDISGKVVNSSVICPICGNVIVLYSSKERQQGHAAIKTVGTGDET